MVCVIKSVGGASLIQYVYYTQSLDLDDVRILLYCMWIASANQRMAHYPRSICVEQGSVVHT